MEKYILFMNSKINIIKVSMLPKLTYIFMSIPIKILIDFCFLENIVFIDHLILKGKWRKNCKSVSVEKQGGGIILKLW